VASRQIRRRLSRIRRLRARAVLLPIVGAPRGQVSWI
jgi:hypothetical protein